MSERGKKGKVAHVPEDVIVEIQLRLPVLSLICSKVVCKRCLPLCFWTEKDALLLQHGMNRLFSCHHDTLNFDPIEIDGHNRYSQFAVHQETLVSIM
ncbi:hypothetical protein Leryth_007333 [Lithospermum erythrorhizon]|nr:hypothetical protein Leryth_007333 [Lithospermum erythrorhizon]